MAASSALKNSWATHHPARTTGMLGANATIKMPREPPASPVIIHGRRMPSGDAVRSLSLPKNGLATIASSAPVPATSARLPGARSIPTSELTFNAKVTSKGAMNSREVLMYASAYSEINPHPTRCAAGDSGSSAASAAVRYFNPRRAAVGADRGGRRECHPPGSETSGIALSSRRYGAGRLTEHNARYLQVLAGYGQFHGSTISKGVEDVCVTAPFPPAPAQMVVLQEAPQLTGTISGCGSLLELHDVGDHAGDVVRSAALDRQVDQLPDHVLRVGDRAQHLPELLRAQHAVQAVRAQQIAVARRGVMQLQVGLGLLTVDGPQQQRPLGMRGGLGRGDAALVDQRLHQGVVVRDLEKLAVPEQVGPRVADVDERELGAGPEHGGQRGAESLQRRIGLHDVLQRLVGLVNRMLEGVQQLASRQLGVERSQGIDGGGAGDLAPRMTAEAVGDREQPRARVGRVLVQLTVQADIRTHGIADSEGLVRIKHDSVLPRQVIDEKAGQVPPGRRGGLDTGPVRRDFAGGRQLPHHADPGNRHAEPPQPRDQAGMLQPAGVIEPIAGYRVDVSRPSSS